MEEVVEGWTENVTQDTVAEDRSTEIMDWLVNFMASAWKILKKPHSTGKEDEGPRSKEMARCFLCRAKSMKPTSITRHYKSKRVSTGIFDCLLFYLECLDLGLESIIINGASVFHSQVKEAYGKIHALCLDTLPAGKRVGPACFISRMQQNISGSDTRA